MVLTWGQFCPPTLTQSEDIWQYLEVLWVITTLGKLLTFSGIGRLKGKIHGHFLEVLWAGTYALS